MSRSLFAKGSIEPLLYLSLRAVPDDLVALRRRPLPLVPDAQVIVGVAAPREDVAGAGRAQLQVRRGRVGVGELDGAEREEGSMEQFGQSIMSNC